MYFFLLLLGLILATLLIICLIVLYRDVYIKRLNRQSNLAQTSLGPIEYRLAGDSGPVLLFIHGTPGGHDQTQATADGYRVLTPSRPGYLRTPLSVGMTPFEQACALNELLEVLDIHKVVIMGVSGGGPASMEFAANFPDKTLGLIALEAVSFSEDFRAVDSEIFDSSDVSLWFKLSLLTLLSNKILASQILPNKNSRKKLLASPNNIKHLKKLIWSIWPLTVRSSGFENDYKQFRNISIPFERIRVPTLVIHGDEDISVDIKHGRHTNKLIAHSKMHLISEGDHMMMSSHADEIGEIIKDFIAQVAL